MHLHVDVRSDGKINIIYIEKNLHRGEMTLPVFSENGQDELHIDCVTILASLKHKLNGATVLFKTFHWFPVTLMHIIRILFVSRHKNLI